MPTESETKFIVSDHPVTIYNRSCTPENPRWCKGPDDPDIRLHATHTLFPLSSERLLILTNRLWACNPHRPPIEMRPNPNFFRGAMFNFLEIQARRGPVGAGSPLKINYIIKRRAYRYIAAGREEWLYPEAPRQGAWKSRSEADICSCPTLGRFTPEPRSSSGYGDGSNGGEGHVRPSPGHSHFGHEARSARRDRRAQALAR